MNYEYDPKLDILLMKIGKEKPDYGEQKGNVITHYSKAGKVVEIEILDASKEATHMMKTILRAKALADSD